MTRVLVVTASPRGAASVSNRLVHAVLDGLVGGPATGARPDVERWDLWTDSAAPFGPREVEAKMSVIGGEEPRGSAAAAWQRLVEAFDRFVAADTYVFGVPMWNGSIPWVLKRWIDTVTQPGLLFRFDPVTGYRGLLCDKRAAVVYTSSVYHPGAEPSFGTDHHSTYFDSWLSFAGISDIRTVRLQPAHPRSADYARREAIAIAAARSIGRSLALVRPSVDEEIDEPTPMPGQRDDADDDPRSADERPTFRASRSDAGRSQRCADPCIGGQDAALHCHGDR